MLYKSKNNNMKTIFTLLLFSICLSSCKTSGITGDPMYSEDGSSTAESTALTSPTFYYAGPSGANLRESRSSTTAVKKMPTGSQVLVLRIDPNGWYYVTVDGVRYHVKSNELVAKAEDTTLTKAKSTQSSYTPSRTIHTGPRGGQYYINKNGNKTYIKRK